MIKAGNEVYTPDNLKTIAMVVDTAIDQVVGLTNTKHLNRYIFAGEKIGTKPFDFDGNNVTYNGNSNTMNMEISPYSNVPVNEGGDVYLEKILKELVTIRDQIASGDRVGLTASMTTHNQNMDAVTNKMAEIGVRVDSLKATNEAFIEQNLNLEQRRSNVEDVDFTELMIDFSISQRTFTASLKASSMMFETSILDYI
jgi:flagellin-like hook-associated protein FlgL